MRRLLQFGVLLLGLATVLTPLLEFFDRWDPPGPPCSDTELTLFSLVLLLCLILLISKLVATLLKPTARITLSTLRSSISFPSISTLCFNVSVASPPLRI